MITKLIAKEGFTTLEEVSAWSNNLIGKAAPDSPNFKFEKIVQFQLIQKGDSYGVILMVELERRQSMSSMVMEMRKDLNLINEG
ncbi:MAG: hypothetical protein KDI79_10425 [Anaerolineae bacterium]|nr:hypothetical protein [Anaerolineae bacterium]